MSPQSSMFETEDLPLFSGTAQRAELSPFAPRPEPQQESLADCQLCADTGQIGDIFCWCQAGQEAKARHDRALRRERLIVDARTLSSDTIGSLTGRNCYADIERIQAGFVSWCAGFHSDYPDGFETWQAAWDAYWSEVCAQYEEN